MWEDIGDRGGVDIAEVCLNGHVITIVALATALFGGGVSAQSVDVPVKTVTLIDRTGGPARPTMTVIVSDDPIGEGCSFFVAARAVADIHEGCELIASCEPVRG